MIQDESITGLPKAGEDTKEQADMYTPRQVDRWGTYKQTYYNLFNGQTVMNNSEFPYSLQVSDNDPYDRRLLADRFASKWQLNSITTMPSVVP